MRVEYESRPPQEYRTLEYAASGKPAAPAVVVGDELVAQGKIVEKEVIEEVINRKLGLKVPETSNA